MKQLITITILLLVANFKIHAQDSVKTDHYCLNFQTYENVRTRWIRHFPSYCRIDTNEIKDGKHPLKLSSIQFNGLPFMERFRKIKKPYPFQFNLYQKIFMPEMDKKSEARITIVSKAQNTSDAKLGVAGFDENEAMIYVDSLDLNNASGWQSQTLEFPCQALKYIKIDIRGAGKPGTDGQAFWIDKIDFSINNRSIYDYPLPNDTCIDRKLKLNHRRMQPLSRLDNNSYQSIPSFSDPQKSIIALGESLHGGEDLCGVITEAMKSLIVNNNCKMVLLEKGTVGGIKWDLYVRGLTPDSTLNEIEEDIRQNKESVVHMKEFLHWLRVYNQGQTKKVRLFGIDDASNSRTFLFEYFVLLNENRRDSNFVNLLRETRELNYNRMIQIVESDSIIKNKIGEKDVEYLLGIFNREKDFNVYYADTLNVLDYQFKYEEARESHMAARAKWLIKSHLEKGEKAVLYTHSGHINKLGLFDSRYSHIPNRSLGHYLFQEFGDQYYAIAVQAGVGTFQETIDPFGSQRDGMLTPPPFNSFERCALKLGEDFFFYATKYIPSGVSYIRHIPQESIKSQFVFMALEKRFDGLIFVKESRALTNGVKIGMAEGVKFNDKRRKKRRLFMEKLEAEIQK